MPAFFEIFERVKYKKLYKKAVQYLNHIDDSVLIQASDKVQSYHINEQVEIGTEIGYFHHLPLKDTSKFYLSEDNWDLPDETKKEIRELLGVLDEYQRSISIIRYYDSKGKFNMNGCPFICEVLPPWIVFPHYSAMSIAWRQGDGEGYMEIFLSYMESLSEEQYHAYFQTYPMPEYMKVNRFGFNIMNHNIRSGALE